jgi:hypothetical protein
MSKSALVGLVSGLVVVVVTLIVIGIANMPEAEGADSPKLRGTAECHQIQVPQDPGYGWTRKVARDVCDSD